MSVEYLSLCNLDQDAQSQSLNMRSELDFPCLKYLIDCYAHGRYNWYEQYYDSNIGVHRELIYFICRYSYGKSDMYCTY